MTETIAYSGPRITPVQVAEGVLQTGIKPAPNLFHDNPKSGHRCAPVSGHRRACGLGIIVAVRFGVRTLARVGNKADETKEPCVVFNKLGLDDLYGEAFMDGFDNYNRKLASNYLDPATHSGWNDGVMSRIAADAAWDQLQAADSRAKGTP